MVQRKMGKKSPPQKGLSEFDISDIIQLYKKSKSMEARVGPASEIASPDEDISVDHFVVTPLVVENDAGGLQCVKGMPEEVGQAFATAYSTLNESDPDRAAAMFREKVAMLVSTDSLRKLIAIIDATPEEVEAWAGARARQRENEDQERQIEDAWKELLNSTKSQELISSEYLGRNIGEILDRVIDQNVAFIVTRKDQKLGMISKCNKSTSKVDRSVSSQELARNRTILDEHRQLLITRRKKIQAVFHPAPKK